MKRPQSRNLHRRYHRRIDALHPVVPFRARSVDVVPHADVHREFLVDFPVVLDEPPDLEALRTDQVRDLVLAPRPRTAISNQKTRHSVATAGIRLLRRAGEMELENARRNPRLREVVAMHAAFSSELDFVLSPDPAHRAQQVMRFLSLAQIAPGLRSYGIGTLAVGAVHVYRGDERYAGSVNVVGETEKLGSVQIFIVARNAVGPDRASREPPRHVQQQRRGEGVRE